MKTRVLAVAFATVAATIAADAASAREAVHVSDRNPHSNQRSQKAPRLPIQGSAAAEHLIADRSAHGWSAPYVGGSGGYAFSTDW